MRSSNFKDYLSLQEDTLILPVAFSRFHEKGMHSNCTSTSLMKDTLPNLDLVDYRVTQMIG